MLKLLVEQIKESVPRENFQKIEQFVRDENLLRAEFKFFEFTFLAVPTVATFTIKHGLGYRPKDLIQTSLIGSGTVTWNYASFSNTEISLTLGGTISVTSPTTVRFFLGSYS